MSWWRGYVVKNGAALPRIRYFSSRCCGCIGGAIHGQICTAATSSPLRVCYHPAQQMCRPSVAQSDRPRNRRRHHWVGTRVRRRCRRRFHFLSPPSSLPAHVWRRPHVPLFLVRIGPITSRPKIVFLSQCVLLRNCIYSPSPGSFRILRPW